MITVKDLLKIDKVVEDRIKESLDERLKLLPTKEEFFSRMDKLAGEIESMRQAFTLHDGDHEQINRRLDKHDQLLHVSTAS